MSSVVARAGGIIVDDTTLEKRSEAMRARNEQRLKQRLSQGTRERSIGLDVQALNQQVEEKHMRERREAQDEEMNVRQGEDIRRYVTELEMKQHLVRKGEALNIAEEWKQQKAQHEAKYGVKDNEPALDPEAVGISAAQSFQGEDVASQRRKKIQQEQFRQWNNQQQAERQEKRSQERKQQNDYASYTQSLKVAIDEIENQVEYTRKTGLYEVKKENLDMAEQRRLREQERALEEERLAQEEIGLQTKDPLLMEDPSIAAGRAGRLRVDHYKGLSAEEKAKILASNRELAEYKRQQKLQEEESEKVLASQTRAIHQKVEALEVEEARRRRKAREDQTMVLEQQKKEAREREQRNRQAGRGAIDSGFFDKFGRSVR